MDFFSRIDSFPRVAPDIKIEENDEAQLLSKLQECSLEPILGSRNLPQLLSMADAFNKYYDEPSAEKAISDAIAQHFAEGAHLQSRSESAVNLMPALHLAYRLGDYGLIDLVEGAGIQQLHASATEFATTLHTMTRYFPADSKAERNFVLDNRTAAVFKLMDDFGSQTAQTRNVLALAKNMRQGV
ncbi:hypothetical protein DFH07DRAFT_68338 [Mycena maculata]|uniref:Uncharacterized protein n=1 Tax=Mycena maculata TaxID=230809 RepID=A0AAD7N0H0_9AGAR|nr:hypothetical protein DFH07DRAFT_68338 [Mycena maculata]